MKLYPGDLGAEPALDPPDDDERPECEACGCTHYADASLVRCGCECHDGAE